MLAAGRPEIACLLHAELLKDKVQKAPQLRRHSSVGCIEGMQWTGERLELRQGPRQTPGLDLIGQEFVGLQHHAQDVPAEQTRLMAATQNPVRAKNFEEKVTAAAWKTRPSWYVVSEQGHMIQPALQTAMATKISAHVVSLSAGHAPHLSQPEEFVKVILAATAAVSKR